MSGLETSFASRLSLTTKRVINCIKNILESLTSTEIFLLCQNIIEFLLNFLMDCVSKIKVLIYFNFIIILFVLFIIIYYFYL